MMSRTSAGRSESTLAAPSPTSSRSGPRRANCARSRCRRAQRSRRQHQGGACRRGPGRHRRRRSGARHDPGHQRHRRAPRRARGLITTQGFGDVLDIGAPDRQHLYRLDLPAKRGAAGAAPSCASGWPSASAPTASSLTRLHLDANAIAESCERSSASGVESVAVCLLHAYANPAHEQALGAALAGAIPYVSRVERDQCRVPRVSSAPPRPCSTPRSCPSPRATSTTCSAGPRARAAASPAFGRRHGVVGGRGPRPLAMAMSGPAAGVSAAAQHSRHPRARQAARLRHGRHDDRRVPDRRRVPETARPAKLGDYPVRCPWSPWNRSARAAARIA